MGSTISSRSWSIQQLKREFEKQIFAIPELQRVFVWDKNKICSLLDSIYKNYPIGTALLWQVDRDKSIIVRHNEIALPPFDPQRNKTVLFIIDGQQRLSVIYNVIKGNKVRSGNQEIDFRKVYFSVNAEHDKYFYYLKRIEDHDLVCVSDLIQKKPSWFKGKYNIQQQKKIAICRHLILKYKFYFLTTNTKYIEEVRETFIRINSLGTQVSSSDRAFARATKIDLRKLVSTLKSRFTGGFENIPDKVILATVGLIEGANEVGEKSIEYFVNKIVKEEFEKKQFQKKWGKIEKAIGKTIDYLKGTFQIDDYRYLPSTNMLSTLSCFYFYNNLKEPNLKQRIEIKKWFWHTGLTSRYSGRGFRKNILMDSQNFFKKLATLNSHKYVIRDKISKQELLNTDYSKNTSLGASYYLLLKKNQPKYLDNGAPIILSDFSTIANRSDKHHIFPQEFLKRKGVTTNKINSIMNICFLAAEENQKIGGTRPPLGYLENYWNKQHFGQVMRSHLIPYSNSSHLWGLTKKEYMLFLEERVELISKAFEKEIGTTIFEKK